LTGTRALALLSFGWFDSVIAFSTDVSQKVTVFPIILVDATNTREALAERLRMQGYVVTVTASAAEGAAMALADPPAAVVADLWMPGISGVQLCRLLRAEAATERVPVILRGPDLDRHSRFWADRAGATAYVGQGRMGDLVRALTDAIAATAPAQDSFIQLCGEDRDIRDRIAAHLDTALFESVVASEIRALSACASFGRLMDLLAQFVSRVSSYRWLAVYTQRPERMGLHTHPLMHQRVADEARAVLAPFITSGNAPTVAIVAVEDEDAYRDERGATPIHFPIRLGTDVIGAVALAPLETPHPKDVALVSIISRELAGPLRIVALVEESQRLATIDPLTSLMNRRAFTASLAREVARSQRHAYPLSLLLLDVDHFKAINDRRGHSAGDAVLAALGPLLVRHIRKVDFAGRWGGEEFVVALASADCAGGLISAERIRAAVGAMEVKDTSGETISVTVSVGVASFEKGDHVDALIDRADRAMYAAKSSGRNRVMNSYEPDDRAAPSTPQDQPSSEPGSAARDKTTPLILS
jgi:diguanylate cyclase (GGDEF)-like protein